MLVTDGNEMSKKESCKKQEWKIEKDVFFIIASPSKKCVNFPRQSPHTFLGDEVELLVGPGDLRHDLGINQGQQLVQETARKEVVQP